MADGFEPLPSPVEPVEAVAADEADDASEEPPLADDGAIKDASETVVSFAPADGPSRAASPAATSDGEATDVRVDTGGLDAAAGCSFEAVSSTLVFLVAPGDAVSGADVDTGGLGLIGAGAFFTVDLEAGAGAGGFLGFPAGFGAGGLPDLGDAPDRGDAGVSTA